MPTPWSEGEGHTEGGDEGEPPEDPAESKALRMCGHSLHGKRESQAAPGDTQGRSGRATSRKPDMYAARQSNGGIVPEKQSNKDGLCRRLRRLWREGRQPRGTQHGTATVLDTVPLIRVACSCCGGQPQGWHITPAARTGCGNPASPGLCGGRSERAVPTAKNRQLKPAERSG